MIYIIKEERNETKVNLTQLFTKLNHEVFNDELILNFPLTWRKLKNVAGQTYAMGYIDIKMIVRELAITNYYDMTISQITNVMIHEMIHVLLFQKQVNDRGGAHGHYFQQEMNRINKHFPHYHVTPKESGDLLSIDSSHIGDKMLKGYIIDKNQFLLVQKPSEIEDDYIINIFKRQARMNKKDYILEYFETNDPFYFKFKAYRTIPRGRIELYPLTTDEINKYYSKLNIKWSKLIKPDGTITTT